MNIYFICILAMNGVDSLSLDLFSAISPDVSSPDVIVDADGDPATFPQGKLDSDEQSIPCATFRLFKIGDVYIYIGRIEKIGCSFWFDMELCSF